MAEPRKKIGSVLLKFSGNTIKLELFEATQWQVPESDAGLYRVRRGSITSGKWVQPVEGEGSPMFFTPEALAKLLARELTGTGGLDAVGSAAPMLRKGQPIRIWPAPHAEKGTLGCARAYAASDPIQCIDGTWKILVAGRGFVDCALVQGLDHFGKEIR
jgi:hypothetical protein